MAAFATLTDFLMLNFGAYELCSTVFLSTMRICSGAMINKERVSAGDQVLLEPEDPTSPLHVGTVVYLYEGSQVRVYRPLVGFLYLFYEIPPVLSMLELSCTYTRDRSGFICLCWASLYEDPTSPLHVGTVATYMRDHRSGFIGLCWASLYEDPTSPLHVGTVATYMRDHRSGFIGLRWASLY
jgi:hypothetical protein